MGSGISGHSMFLYELNKNGITLERMKNKQNKVYGLKFSYGEHTFKASEIGREFGYRSLQKNFEATNREEPRKSHQTVQEPTENNKQPDTSYELVPKSRSSISRDNDTPQVQKEEYLIKNACYSPVKYYLCKQNNKRSLLGRKQRSQVVRSFPNRYLFSFTNKVTSLFSIRCILRIILSDETIVFAKH